MSRRSQFANQLQKAIEDAGTTQFAIHQKTGISQGALSRYVSADNRPPPDVLGTLLNVFPESIRPPLLEAYLLDDVPLEHRRLVNITTAGGEQVYVPPAPADVRARMRRDLREAYDGIGAAAIERPEVAESIISTWQIIRPS